MSPAGDDVLRRAGAGEMATLVAEHDWAQTPLGPSAEWPETPPWSSAITTVAGRASTSALMRASSTAALPDAVYRRTRKAAETTRVFGRMRATFSMLRVSW